MATASPTPLGSSHFANPSRRPASRQGFRAPATKLNPGRSTASSVAAVERSYGHERYAARAGEYSLNDSSDDELPAPMIFSALTKALLNDEGSILPPSSPAKRADTVSGSTAVDTAQRHATADAFANGGEAAQETTAPQEQTDPSPYPRRVVRLSGTPRSTIFKRSVSSVNGVRNAMEDTGAKVGSSPELNTPSHPIRTVRLSVTSTSRYGQSVGSSGRDSNGTNSVARRADDDTDMLDDPATVARTQLGIGHGSVTRYGAIGRGTWVAENGLQSSMRVKPLKKVAGSFLSGPARRGRRRQSEEDEARAQEIEDEAEPGSSSQEPDSQGSQVPNNASEQATKQSPAAYYSSYQGSFASGSPISLKPPISTQRSATTSYADKAELMLSIKETTPREPPSLVHPVFKIPGPPPDLPSANDQENEAPPTFKRNKPEVFTHFGKVEKVAIRPDRSALEPVASPQRQALAPRSQNTPRRPAPPPPKMSVLETVTATAGAAATSHASKKRNNVRVNGKVFTRMDLVGRGGSSKVWRVMAENGKVFALKRVSLEDADENAVRGYKGEIDLLKKLEGNDRVVRLLDYEMNEDKQTLSVLMEMGELDFDKVFKLRTSAEDSKFDPSFTRHYWKEMLECIEAVHEHDIVHSDLKPANFVLVQGRLKLIDFGIANAIETDETVNVHRDTQIGTPNYMSPESLMDANELPGASKSNAHSQAKVMKLGKPSDIWSLGCILYQMAYGRPPFAHIQNTMSRCRAIINFNHPIEFPPFGLGDVRLPPSLIRTMKKCLNRDQRKRPSASELLNPNDPFLNPVECDEDAVPITQEVLGRILMDVASKFKTGIPSDAELLTLWSSGYMNSVRKALKDTKLH